MENFYSSYPNSEGEDTLRMDQCVAHLPMGTRGRSKEKGMRIGFGSKLIVFLVVISKIEPELHGLDMQRGKHIKLI